jgi:pimeloyl-ACP methyl ester carboxylesterase
MHYELSGDGSPSLVLVHGFACDHMHWSAQVEALSERHCVVTCDLRGHGYTPGNPQDCSIETYGADVAELVEALQLAPAVLVGHSMGCRIVLEAACQRPRSTHVREYAPNARIEIVPGTGHFAHMWRSR